jgi:hypothetical protein
MTQIVPTQALTYAELDERIDALSGPGGPHRALSSFYPGSSQPADMLGYIQDGLAWSALNGGWLLIEDSEEPWEVSGTIVPPPNSRMVGTAGQARFSERNGATHGTGHGQFPVLPNAIGDAWIRLASGANCPILANDHDNSEGLRGPARGNGAYVQWFTAMGVVFDHNGLNQTGSLTAIHVRDAWGMNFPYCRLVSPRGRGIVIANSNDCNAEKFSIAGIAENVANGTGDMDGTTTVLNASASWAIGDLIVAGGTSTYVTNVVSTTLTLAAAAGLSATAGTLYKPTYITTDGLVLEDSTTDSDWIGISVHAFSQAGVMIDSAYGCRVSGLSGYAIGGYNLWLRDTLTGSANYIGCLGNKLDLRLDQATKHNARLDSGAKSNSIEVVAFAPGMFNTPVDADGGWANVFCDGTNNVLKGTGFKGSLVATLPSPTSVVAYGSNAVNNEGQMTGGHDLTVGTPIYRYAAEATKRSNTEPGKPKSARPDMSWVRLSDDFTGDVLADQWNGRAGSDPQAVVPTINVAANGTVRLETGDDAAGTMATNGSQLDQSLNWASSQSARFETRIKIGPGITFFAVFVGFTDQVAALEMPFELGGADALTSNATNAVGFLYDTSATTDNWWAVGVKADVDATKQNLAVAPTLDTYETLRVELYNSGSAIFYRNDAVIGSVMSNAVTTTTPLTPVIAALSRTTASRTLDVDYIVCEQTRTTA